MAQTVLTPYHFRYPRTMSLPEYVFTQCLADWSRCSRLNLFRRGIDVAISIRCSSSPHGASPSTGFGFREIGHVQVLNRRSYARSPKWSRVVTLMTTSFPSSWARIAPRFRRLTSPDRIRSLAALSVTATPKPTLPDEYMTSSAPELSYSSETSVAFTSKAVWMI